MSEERHTFSEETHGSGGKTRPRGEGDGLRGVKRGHKKRAKFSHHRHVVHRRTQSSSVVSPHPACLTHRLGPNQTDDFSMVYTTGEILGKGGYGSVFSGIRTTDGEKEGVAIKYVKRYRCDPYLRLPGEAEALPLEVALMQLVSRSPGCPYVLQLLEWFEEPKAFVLVLERPFPCMDLFEFQDQFGGRLDECLARVIFLQVVHAVLHCSQRGVLHRDIKPENLVVQTDTLRIKLIDFGCGDLLREDDYRDFAGTEDYVPPEWFIYGRYNGQAATVWSLGILLFSMVCGAMPFDKESEIVRGQLKFIKGLSEECKHLIGWCLNKNPAKRPILRQVLLHDWMTGWQTA